LIRPFFAEKIRGGEEAETAGDNKCRKLGGDSSDLNNCCEDERILTPAPLLGGEGELIAADERV
jgi:hypothetical protein